MQNRGKFTGKLISILIRLIDTSIKMISKKNVALFPFAYRNILINMSGRLLT